MKPHPQIEEPENSGQDPNGEENQREKKERERESESESVEVCERH